MSLVYRNKNKTFTRMNRQLRNLEKSAAIAHDKFMQDVFERAQSFVPIDTGFMKSTGKLAKSRLISRRRGYMEASIQYTAFYSLWVHEGHMQWQSGNWVEGQPWLFNAVMHYRYKYRQYLREEGNRAIKAGKIREMPPFGGFVPAVPPSEWGNI